MSWAAHHGLWIDADCYHILHSGQVRRPLFHGEEDGARLLRLVGRDRDHLGLRQHQLYLFM